jgi:hypothetical protein
MASSALYDADILEWSEQQASALRNLALARPDLSNVIDWENVAEEIEDVGRSQFNAVRSYIRQILIHVVKALSVPDSQSLLHWHTEVRGFHGDLIDGVAPSMISRVDLPDLWRRAVKDAGVALAEHGQSLSSSLPRQCPLTVEEIVNPDFDFLHVVERIRAQISRDRPSA